ncbi:iron chelate uptake ABC transporter family permease subunit [Vibrio viridaestus]|uniref:Iron-dicitrate transporter permease subunit n=1 Tax=Vibrio viridaestus TaxID=2487322 RepID=A0A3N9TL35_9VIBR|nr:iron chelate uptake ABC transporter family permease subunit [Vibrio viridaestus]RQW64831.1 iron-dicitrate transporter permease subunit [Vibrio viridaestus]
MIRYVSIVLILIVVTVLTSWWGLSAFSAFPISSHDALLGLFRPDQDSVAQVLVQDVRLPRILVALLVGASLAAAGCLMQALTQNPLASPGLFGVNAGAILGIALVSTFAAASSPISSAVAAMIGGATTWTLVMMIGGGFNRKTNKAQLVLAGIAISALCAAITKASVILVEDQASSVMVWLAGSFASVEWSVVDWLAPIILVSLLVCTTLAPRLNVLVMGDERAMTLGVNLSRLRFTISIAVLILVGISISAVGSIAFVGLLVPHIGRYLVGYDHRKLLPVCMVLGSFLCVLADVLSRAVIFPTETPAGAVLALIGAPCFLYLVRRRAV